jgi:hypothetical protein
MDKQTKNRRIVTVSNLKAGDEIVFGDKIADIMNVCVNNHYLNTYSVEYRYQGLAGLHTGVYRAGQMMEKIK